MDEKKIEDTQDLTEPITDAQNVLGDEEDLKIQLRLLETAYISSQGMEVGDEATDKLFPRDWFEDTDFAIKMKILVDAISDDKTIMETDEYQKMIEGSRMSK